MLDENNEDDITNEFKRRVIKNEENWFAVLDKSPKTLGHTIVISKKPYDDIIEKIDGLDNNEIKKELLKASLDIADKIKNSLFPKEKRNEGKIYFLTMCDHYEMWETSTGETTEHLHIHLIPRHPGMSIKGEKLINLKKPEQKIEPLEKIRDLIVK